MATAFDANAPEDRSAEQRQISNEIKNFVAYELVRPAQPAFVHNAPIVEHYCVSERAPTRETRFAHSLDLRKKPKGPRSGNILYEICAIHVFDFDALVADRLMLKVNCVDDVKLSSRLNADSSISVCDFNGSQHLDHRLRGRLLMKPSAGKKTCK